jgi:membrane protein YqaA with SNARE-associated domain
MRVFSALYRRVMAWSMHRHAPRYLAGLSFAESSFFPVPPDVMLAPMALAKPERAWEYAALTTVASVLGGALGYLLGLFAFETIAPLIQSAGYESHYVRVNQWFAIWGFWVVFLAGFSPIPYKLFTIAAGAAAMPFVPFIFASLIGRGMRFFLVAGLMVWGGARIQPILRKHIDRLGWITVITAVVLYFVLRH